MADMQFEGVTIPEWLMIWLLVFYSSDMFGSYPETLLPAAPGQGVAEPDKHVFGKIKRDLNQIFDPTSRDT